MSCRRGNQIGSIVLSGAVLLTAPIGHSATVREPAGAVSAPRVENAALPRVHMLPAASLAAARTRWKQKDKSVEPAVTALLEEADKLLTIKPFSVMDKTKVAVSGDKHDYFSCGPYWWPDPSKPDGLPYIQRDGQTNPENIRGTDADPFQHVCTYAETLGLAYYFTGKESYAEKAALLTRVWFIDPATRMNPHLRYAQAIPGITDGRGIGLIGGRYLPQLLDGIALLDGSPAWTSEDQAALHAWFESYYHWLCTHENPQTESSERNNHGTFFDVQIVGIALALGRIDEAHAILEAGLQKRLASQVEPDGSQPQELERPKSLHYVCFNLDALFKLARLGECAGVDWWNYRTADGRSLHNAAAVVAPFIDPAKPWLKNDSIQSPDRTRILAPLLAEACAHYRDPEFHALLARFAPAYPLEARWRIFWPAQ